MNFLLLFRVDGGTLDEGRVLMALEEMPGVSALRVRKGVGSVLECEYDLEGDATLIRLKDDLETIAISGTGEASLTAALELQRRLATALRLVDSDYTFDVELQDVGSVEELRAAIGGSGMPDR